MGAVILKTLLITLLMGSLIGTGCTTSLKPSPSASEGDLAGYELNIELPGTMNAFLLDGLGGLRSDVQVASTDGVIRLRIGKGTILLDKEGKPLELIRVASCPTLPPLPEDAYIIGSVYDLSPGGATASPPLELTLSYNVNALPSGIGEGSVSIALYENGKWDIARYKRIDKGNHNITTQIDHFTSYAVLAPREQPESPKPSPQTGLALISLTQALSNGKPTIAEFGSSTCIPCKQMKPILEELAVEYQDELNVVIVEVYEQEALTRQYDIMVIPTQIIFDGSGKEVTRHMGFWSKEEIVVTLKKMG